MSEALDYGERKHETCRFGRLTKAYRVAPPIEGEPPRETPTVAPLCTWQPPEPYPPGLKRVWGGLVELDRDCAVCLAHEPVPIDQATPPPTGQ